MLLLLPQRYIFSSKSQQRIINPLIENVVVATTKVHIFKQITTIRSIHKPNSRCCCYHKGTYFQANHNEKKVFPCICKVVVATTKVHIFKQITTNIHKWDISIGCCCYHKGTYFQANHNRITLLVVYI